jgi:hypothetical protein
MHTVVTHDHLRGNTEFHRVDWKAGRSCVWNSDLLPGRYGHWLRSRSAAKGTGRWNRLAAPVARFGRNGVGHAAQPARGADFCNADASGTGHRGVRRPGEGTEWSNATGHLYADAHHYIQRTDTNAAQLLNARRQIAIGTDWQSWCHTCPSMAKSDSVPGSRNVRAIRRVA